MDDQSRAVSLLALTVSLLCATGLVAAGLWGAWMMADLEDALALQDQRMTTAEAGIMSAQTQLIRFWSNETPATQPHIEPEE